MVDARGIPTTIVFLTAFAPVAAVAILSGISANLVLGYSLAVVAAALIMPVLRLGAVSPRPLVFGAIALAAVLPVYSIESHGVWMDGAYEGGTNAPLALDAVIAASQLVVGVVWPLLALVSPLRTGQAWLRLDRRHGANLSLLLLVSMYALTVYMRGSISLLDAPVVLMLFGVFIWTGGRHSGARASHLRLTPNADAAEEGLVNPTKTAHMMYALAIVLLSASIFVGSTVFPALYELFGPLAPVSWMEAVAPMSPWIALAAVLAWKVDSNTGAATILGSQLALWLLLFGLLPVVWAMQGPTPWNLEVLVLDSRQGSELLLTATQTIFAVALVSRLEVSRKAAAGLILLFIGHSSADMLQSGWDANTVRDLFSIVYVTGVAAMVSLDRGRLLSQHYLCSLLADHKYKR